MRYLVFLSFLPILAACTLSPNVTHIGKIVTPEGEIAFELYGEAAPLSVSNFVEHIEAGLYEGANFYRSVEDQQTSHGACCVNLVQGGIYNEVMGKSMEEIASAMRDHPIPSIPHEPTNQTGLRHLRGSLSMGRMNPGTATSEFYVTTFDNPVLDYGGSGHPDRLGYAVFGKVTDGMQILDAIQSKPTKTEKSLFTEQLLIEPVLITQIEVFRVSSDKQKLP